MLTDLWVWGFFFAAQAYWVFAFAALGLGLGYWALRWHPLGAFAARALPLCGAAVTFFAAAKKVTKESRF
jgi:hypothetical protein